MASVRGVTAQFEGVRVSAEEKINILPVDDQPERAEACRREPVVELAEALETQKVENLGQATGGIAHDFNNLLMALLGNLELLRKIVAGNPSACRLIDGAIQNAERGAILTKRMRD